MRASNQINNSEPSKEDAEFNEVTRNEERVNQIEAKDKPEKESTPSTDLVIAFEESKIEEIPPRIHSGIGKSKDKFRQCWL